MCRIKAWPDRKLTHYLFVRGTNVTRAQRDECASSRLSLFQQLIHLGHDLEGIGNVEHVGFAAGPTAIGVEIDRAAFVDKTPPDHMGFLAMTTRGKPFWVTWSGTGLAHLIQVGHESQHRLVFPALIHERLAAAEGSTGRAKKIEDERFGLFRVGLSIG